MVWDPETVFKWLYDSAIAYSGSNGGWSDTIEIFVFHPLRVGLLAALLSLMVPVRRGPRSMLFTAATVAAIFHYPIGMVRYIRSTVIVIHEGHIVWEGSGMWDSNLALCFGLTFLLPLSLGTAAAASYGLYQVRRRILSGYKNADSVTVATTAERRQIRGSSDRHNPYQTPAPAGDDV